MDTIDILNQPQLFVDDSLIADSVGVERRIHSMTRVSPAPVLARTEPWEGHVMAPAAVVYDEPTRRWRMWYLSGGERRASVPGLRGDVMHLAVSDDGVHWEKPALGVFAAQGAPSNNVCVFPDGAPAPGPCVVFHEPAEADPSRRYKMIYYRPNYYLAFSPDGIRWRPAQTEPVWPNSSGDGLEETFFFMRDERLGRYRGYMRVWKRHHTVRKTSLGESDDLFHWTGPKVIWEAEPTFGLGAQIYGMNVFLDGGFYWALPWVFYTDQPLDPALRQTIRLKLAWSRDGVQWNAIAPERDALSLGGPDAFDSAMTLSSCPVAQLPDRLRLYYTGWNCRHNEGERESHIGLAEIRRHGFVSLHADGEGSLITRRFLFRGEGLRINARTAPDGCVLAELLDDRGDVIRSREMARSDPFTGDSVDRRLTWRGNGDLRGLHGQNLMLRLQLRSAHLFSFRADGPPERFSAPPGPHPVRCGRCTKPPVIDGALDDVCWQDFTHSGVAEDFVRFAESTPAPVRTRVMLTRDEEKLYIAVECEEPLSDQLPTGSPDSQVNYARDETVEFRLNAPGQGTHFNQLMVTSTGARWQAWFSVEEGGAWIKHDPDWTARVSAVQGRWYVEMAVPFAALGVASPAPDERWQLNIIRYRHLGGENESSSWSCLFGSVHRNDRSGTLLFA